MSVCITLNTFLLSQFNNALIMPLPVLGVSGAVLGLHPAAGRPAGPAEHGGDHQAGDGGAADAAAGADDEAARRRDQGRRLRPQQAHRQEAHTEVRARSVMPII